MNPEGILDQVLRGMDAGSFWPLLGLILLLAMGMTSMAAERASRSSTRARYVFIQDEQGRESDPDLDVVLDGHAQAALSDRLNLLLAENDQLRARIDSLEKVLDREAAGRSASTDAAGTSISPGVARMVLGLDPDRPHDLRQLRRAFVATALRVHPDHGGSPHGLRLAVACHELLKDLSQDAAGRAQSCRQPRGPTD